MVAVIMVFAVALAIGNRGTGAGFGATAPATTRAVATPSVAVRSVPPTLVPTATP